MTWEQLCKLGRAWPEVSVGTSYGTPALCVRGKMFLRLKEDGKTIVLFVENLDEQELLCATRDDVYYITDHYRGYPAVLARLPKLRVAEARAWVERGWRTRAPKKLLKAYDAGAKPQP